MKDNGNGLNISNTRWGDNVVRGWIKCSKQNCGFGVHKYCADIIYDRIQGVSVDHESFHCNEIQYQVPRDVLAKLKKEARGRGPLDTHNFLKSKANIVKTKKVKTQTQASRKRYSNDLTYCEACECFYDINVENHILNDCPALKSKSAKVGRFPRKRKLTRIVGVNIWADDPVWNRLIEFHTHFPP